MKKSSLLLNINNYDKIKINEIEIDNDFFLEIKTNTNNKFDNILKSLFFLDTKEFKDIYLIGNYYMIRDYILNNPLLKKYRLIIKKEFNANTQIDELEKLDQIFDDINIYIDGKHNIDFVKISEYKKALIEVNKIANRINSYNLSVLEKILYVYDFVRKKEYNEEKKNEEKNISRDFSKVLFNDRINCLGYANLFNAILEKLKINSNLYLYKNCEKNENHVTNIVKIDDKKYNLYGLYYFDITKDRCKGNDDYLNSYLFFAKTKNVFEDLFKYQFKDLSLKNINKIKIKILKITRYLSKKDYFSLYLINQFLDLYSKDKFLNLSKKECIKLFDDSYKFLNKPIKHDILINALYEVRKIQYYEKRKKIDFTKEELIKKIQYYDDFNVFLKK